MFDDVNEESEKISRAFEQMLRDSIILLLNVEPDARTFIERYTSCCLNGTFEFFDYLQTDHVDEKRSLARIFAIQIWNNTPLPSNRYKPVPLPTPKRNEPCFCGSGRKFKQCCSRLDANALPPIYPESVSSLLLELITQGELKQVWDYMPHPLLAFIAGEWAKESEKLAERGLLMLDPIFKQEDKKLDHRDEMAFDTMMELCTLLNKPRKKNALLKRLMEHPDKVLQTVALHRQCTVLGDQGKDDEAWACFQKAQRLSPNDPSLSHLEILLLMQQGKIKQMQQRGKYWIKRLATMNQNGDLDKLIDVIREMVSDTPSSMGGLLEQDFPGVGRFITWLKEAAQNPPKSLNCVKVYDGTGVIEAKNKTAAMLEYLWSERLEDPDELRQGPWVWVDILEAHPELAGSINVMDDLIEAVREMNTPNPTMIFAPLVELAMFQVRQLLPQKPRSPLEWAVMENRPALRVMGFLISTMVELDDSQTELEMMEWILRLNPNDNQGFRGGLINTYLRLNRDNDVIALCKRYPEDFLVSLVYGHALALFRLGEHKKANHSLTEAIKQCPKVAKAITRRSMKEPKSLQPGVCSYGGDDEAWYYREEALDVWQQTPGAMAWIKQQIKFTT